MDKDKFIKDINFLIDITNENNTYIKNKLRELKINFYKVLSQELKEQHKTYINLLKNQ